jgi:hypothetical protein
MLLDRSILGEKPLVVFKIFKGSFEFYDVKNVKRNAALQRKGMEIAMF